MVPVALGEQQEGAALLPIGLGQGACLRLDRITEFPALAVQAFAFPGELEGLLRVIRGQ